MCHIIDNQYENMDFCSVCEIRSIESGEYCSLSDTLDCRNTFESRSCGRCLDDDAFFSCEVFTPLDAIEHIVEMIEIFSFLTTQLDIDSIRESAPNKEFIHISVRSCTRYETILDLYICTPESFTFSSYQGFESRLASENKTE